MPVVFCKPDALYGPHSTVDGQRAAALLTALAARCAGDGLEGVAEAWRTGAQRAATQIAERAGTEPAFRGTLIAPDAAAVRLQQASHVLGSGPVPTRDVLRAAVEGLGFELEAERRVVLGERGVEAVYAGTTTTVEFEDVRKDLVDYLAADSVEVWLLSDRQEECALQWWKTYVRHMLLDRRPGEYLLRNLVHVCDGADADYLRGRVRG
ncbi:hypothetical protein [Streptomyces sp. GC420]|uniref:hypothetical protein n=1 Tax=Streptomyces sp. GC420 TaxID=2697568 RepID=UPI0014152A8C|nr:hypothetical protein [Streptomyces sp. GC420]NBM14465.1 hypothetical protein [Streptomyces sp. GC420]